MGENYAETKAKELRNPFWTDILVSWKKFCNSVPIEKVEHILFSPIWFNSNTGQPRYVKLAYLEYTAYVEVIIHSRIFPLYCIVIRPCLCQTRLS